MKNKVLIFPSGAENALEINLALKYSLHVEVIPASSREDYSPLIYENPVRKLPHLLDPSFIEKLNETILKEDIKLIFPTDDTASLFLSENQKKINANVITSDFRTNEICRFKKKTFEIFKNFDFCPKIYDKILDENQYPIFSKPDVGQGAQGVSLIKSPKQHENLLANPDLIFLEYLPGKEFTIDCFTNSEGKLLFSGIRERSEIKMGISFRCKEIVNNSEVEKIANQINNELKFRGLWFFQLKEDANGKLKLLEISTRTAGTMGFFRHLGINLPLLSVFDFLNFNVEIQKNNYQIELFRTTKNKYKFSFTFDKAYIDLDDTLILNNKVNIPLISFIFQCKNNYIKTILISKHLGNIEETLKNFKISPELFDEIIWLKQDQKKSDYIIPENAIFIDNWYQERKEVFQKYQIPVLDVDMVESLIK